MHHESMEEIREARKMDLNTTADCTELRYLKMMVSLLKITNRKRIVGADKSKWFGDKPLVFHLCANVAAN